MSMAPLEWRFMNVAAISGLFALTGAVAGWSLNQLGLRLARRAEQRESDIRDMDQRVFAAATAATRSARLSDGSSRSTGAKT